MCIIVQPESALNFKDKIYGLALLNSQMDEQKEGRSKDNQKQNLDSSKADNKFSVKHRNLCKLDCH
jgi:hypothetical protein